MDKPSACTFSGPRKRPVFVAFKSPIYRHLVALKSPFNRPSVATPIARFFLVLLLASRLFGFPGIRRPDLRGSAPGARKALGRLPPRCSPQWQGLCFRKPHAPFPEG